MLQVEAIGKNQTNQQPLRRGAEKSLDFPICSKTKIIFLGWVKEVRTTTS
jgi:hypothetical protein